MKKYELTAEYKTVAVKKLYRIRALVSFGIVKEGELGGYIEKEENLSQSGNAWVYGDAEVYGNAKVYGDAKVSDNAWVHAAEHIFTIGPAGSRNDFTTFYRDKDKEITVKCGCFCGKIDKFLEKVAGTHGDSKYALVYRAAVELAKMQIDLTGDAPEDDGK